MAQFRASIKGTRGGASRLGSKATGIFAHVASWGGAVEVELTYDPATDTDNARVVLTRHHGSGCQPERVIYDGPVSGAGCSNPSGWVTSSKSLSIMAHGKSLVIGGKLATDTCLDCGAPRSEH